MLYYGGSSCRTTSEFGSAEFPNQVKLKKSLYSLKQVPRAGYKRLSKFFKNYYKGKIQ